MNDYDNMLGTSLMKLIYSAAALADQISDKPKNKRTSEENEFIQVFEEVGNLVIDPQFLKMYLNRKTQ